MELQIPARNLKLFAKALACLAKIGPEMILEVADDGINVQALNQARSAFVLFRFTGRFFTHYRARPDAAGVLAKVQVQVKACVAVFRAIATVDHCQVVLEPNALLFVMHCRSGVQKKHRLCVEDSTAARAVYNKITPNRVVARSRTLLDCVQNFHTSIEEITMVARASHLTLKSYVEVDEAARGAAGALAKEGGGGGGGGAPSFLKTELVVDGNDFDEYTVRPEACELTFSLKELRAILAFSEAAGTPLSIYFSDAGQPILWSVNCYDALVVDFVLATMGASTGNTQATSTSATPAASAASSATPAGGYARGASPPHNNKKRRTEHDDDDGSGGKGAPPQLNYRRRDPAQHVGGHGEDDDDDDDDDDDNFVAGTPERD